MVDGQVAGRLIVEVESSTAGFGQALKRKIDAAAAGIKAEIGVELDASNLRKTIQAKVDEASAGVNAKIGVDLDAKALRAKVTAAAKAASAKVKITANVEGIAKEVAGEVEKAKAAAPSLLVRMRLRGGVMLEALKERRKAQQALEAKPLEVPVKPTMPRGMRLRNILHTAAIASIVPLIQPAVGAIGQLVAGLTAMTGAATPALGALQAIPVSIGTGVQAMLAGKVAAQGFGDAVKLLAEEQQALADGTALTAEQQAELDKRLKDLSPSARKTAKDFVGLRKEWSALAKDVQEPLFEPIARNLRPLAEKYLPILRTGLKGATTQMGAFIESQAQWLRQSGTQGDIARVMANQNGLLGSFGRALDSVTKGTLNYMVSSEGFTKRLGENVEALGKWYESRAQEGRDSGGTERFLDRAMNKAEQLARITREIGGGLGGVLSAGAPSGNRLLEDFERFVTNWNKWANGADGQKVLGDWFDKAEPGFRELGLLARDTFKGMAKWAADPKIADMINKIRTDLGPKLGKFLKELSDDTGQNVIDFFTELVGVLENLAPAVEPLSGLTSMVNKFVAGLNNMADAAPGIADNAARIAGALLLFRGLKKLPFFGGPGGGGGKGGFLSGLLGGAVGGGSKDGLSGRKGVVPVAVTNWPKGFGGDSGSGNKRGGPAGAVVNESDRDKKNRPLTVVPDVDSNASSKKPKRFAGKTGLAGGIALMAWAMGVPLPKGAEKAMNSGAGQGAMYGGLVGAGTSIGGPLGALVGGGGVQAASNLKTWKSYFKSSEEVGKSQKDIEKKLKGSKVGEYAKDLGLNVKALAEDLSKNGSGGDYVKYVKKRMSEYSGIRANLEEELPGGSNTNQKKRDAGNDLRKIGAGVDGNRAKAVALGQQAITKAVAGMNAALAKSGPFLSRNGAAMQKFGQEGQRARQALMEVGRGAVQVGNQMKAGIGKTEYLSKARAGFVQLAMQAGASRKAARGLADDLGLVGKIKARPTVQEKGAAASRTRVQQLRQQIAQVRSKMVNMNEKGAAAAKARIQKMKEEIQRLKGKSVPVTEKGAGPAKQRVDGLKGSLNAIDGKHARTSVTNTITTERINIVRNFNKGMATLLPPGSADGSTVPKSGRGYRDRYPYLLADGEEVVSNRDGQADRWRPLLKLINANRLAGGGTAGEALRRVANRLDARTGKKGKGKKDDDERGGKNDKKNKSRASAGMKAVAAWVASGFSAGIRGTYTQLMTAQRALVNKLVSAGWQKSSAQGFLNRHSKQLDALERLAKQRDNVTAKLAAAQKNLDLLIQARTSLKEGIAEAAKDFGSVSTIAGGAGGFATPQFLIGELTRRADEATKFRSTLATLMKNGLGRDAYEQISSMGFQQGLPIAQQLTGASKADLTKINQLQAQIKSQAYALGNEGSKQYYDAGIKAGQGLVKGLTSQQATLNKAATNMANALVKQIKAALKIKSPSRVMAGIGQQTIEGMSAGMSERSQRLSRHAQAIASQLASDLSPVAPSPGYMSQLAASRAQAGSVKAAPVASMQALVENLNIQGASREEARDALDEAMFVLRKIRQGGVYAGRTV